jgi:uncharacterized linocin/CFP29 family protein
MTIQIANSYEQQLELISNSRRPRFKKNAGQNDLATNSILLKREWEALDQAVIQSYRIRLSAVADLRAAGLTSDTTLAEMLSSWRVMSERVRPEVNMDGRSRVEQDRTDRKTFSVPIPIISTGYQFSMRELMAARAVGAQLETSEAEEAGQALAEEQERILFNGNGDVVVHGNGIPGLLTHDDRTTDTATNFGGGDFGTAGNAYKTFLGVIDAMSLLRYYGPFNVYLHSTQYNEMLRYETDGTGDMALDRCQRLPQIGKIAVSDIITAGQLVFVQMDRRTIDLRIALDVSNRQWDNPDGSAVFFKTMVSMVPRLKSDYRGKLGVCHVTGA